MYPAGSTQSARHSDERRSGQRLTTSSIVLVHLGPDNGGIVINLSVDGVSCQAAMRLGLQVGTQLNVRLRGSGLNVESLGEIVWIGAKQKEVGIRFRNTPQKTRLEIAGWIDLQRKPGRASLFGEPSPLGPMSPMPGVSAPWDKPAPRPFDALEIPEGKAQDPLASLSADEDGARVAALLDSESGASSVSPRLEIVAPVEEIQDSGAAFESSPASEDLRVPVPHAGALAAPPPPSVEQDEPNLRQPQLRPAGASRQLPAPHVEAIALHVEPAPQPLARTGPAGVAAPPGAVREASKVPQLKAASKLMASRLATRLPEMKDLEKWIPPALLDAWRGGNPRHRLLVAGGATLSLGFFALLLILAASHAVGPSVSPSGETDQRPTQPPAFAPITPVGGAVDPVRPGPQPQIQQLRVQQRNAPRPAATPPQPEAGEATPLEKFAKLFVGSETENPDDAPPPPLPQIRQDQLGVQVWISKTSGFFYCTDDPYFKTVDPGALMLQGDALQNGYRPILNQFCD